MFKNFNVKTTHISKLFEYNMPILAKLEKNLNNKKINAQRHLFY